MQANSSEDLVAGFTTLVDIVDPLLKLEVASHAMGVERSQQRRYRTIYSQNCQVNNTLLNLGGQIEDLIIAMGFTACEIGNPDLKPDFVFLHSESEPFVLLSMCNSTIKQAMEAMQKSIKAKEEAIFEEKNAQRIDAIEQDVYSKIEFKIIDQ